MNDDIPIYQIEIEDLATGDTWLFTNILHVPRVGETVNLFNDITHLDVLQGKVVEVKWLMSITGMQEYTIVVVVDAGQKENEQSG